MTRLEKIIELKKLVQEAEKAERQANIRNNKCMDLPPRQWPRGWKNTSIQAKASIFCRYRDEVLKKLSDYIESWND